MSITRVDKISPLQSLDLESINLLVNQINARLEKLTPSPAAQPTQQTLTLSPTGGIVSNFKLGRGTWFRLAATTNCQLTGLAGGYEGRNIILVNTSTSITITLPFESTASTPENRVNRFGGGAVTLGPNSGGQFIYDGIKQRWIYLGPLTL